MKQLLTAPSTYTHQNITTGPGEIAQQLEWAALAEDQDLIPNTHVAAFKHAYLQFQEIQCPFMAWAGP